jgi:general secretion pathway protein G
MHRPAEITQPPKAGPTRPFSLTTFLACSGIAVGILVMVASYSLGARDFDRRRARAERDLSAIRDAINLYRLQTPSGRLPEVAEVPGVLFEPGTGGIPPALERVLFPTGNLIDPWGNEYLYLKIGNSFEVISYGEDGEPGGQGHAADIVIKGQR